MKHKRKMKYDHSYLLNELHRLDSIWFHTNEEAIEKMIYLYTVLCETEIEDVHPFPTAFAHQYQMKHLGEAKIFLMQGDYISAACELFGRYMQYDCCGVIDAVKLLIETELLDNAAI